MAETVKLRPELKEDLRQFIKGRGGQNSRWARRGTCRLQDLAEHVQHDWTNGPYRPES